MSERSKLAQISGRSFGKHTLSDTEVPFEYMSVYQVLPSFLRFTLVSSRSEDSSASSQSLQSSLAGTALLPLFSQILAGPVIEQRS